MYYPFSENKGDDQLRGYREADLRLCFRIYAHCWFFHVVAHIMSSLNFSQKHDYSFTTDAHGEAHKIFYNAHNTMMSDVSEENILGFAFAASISRTRENQHLRFPTGSDTNRPLQSQKICSEAKV